MQSAYAIPPRAFGSEPGDLAVDFDTLPPPSLTTLLIRACTGLDEEAAWQLTVGERLRIVLTIASLGSGPEFDILLTCPQCRTVSETEWTLDEIVAALPAPPAAVRVETNGTAVHLRLPTGEDQAHWLTRAFSTEREASLFALQSLILDDTVPASLDSLLAPAEAALEAADPLVHFEIVSPCPECGAEMRQLVDWTGYALRRLRESQHRLVADVHRLASRYHWSEAEIFAVPAWRRRLYLASIAGDGE